QNHAVALSKMQPVFGLGLEQLFIAVTAFVKTAQITVATKISQFAVRHVAGFKNSLGLNCKNLFSRKRKIFAHIYGISGKTKFTAQPFSVQKTTDLYINSLVSIDGIIAAIEQKSRTETNRRVTVQFIFRTIIQQTFFGIKLSFANID